MTKASPKRKRKVTFELPDSDCESESKEKVNWKPNSQNRKTSHRPLFEPPPLDSDLKVRSILKKTEPIYEEPTFTSSFLPQYIINSVINSKFGPTILESFEDSQSDTNSDDSESLSDNIFIKNNSDLDLESKTKSQLIAKRNSVDDTFDENINFWSINSEDKNLDLETAQVVTKRNSVDDTFEETDNFWFVDSEENKNLYSEPTVCQASKRDSFDNSLKENIDFGFVNSEESKTFESEPLSSSVFRRDSFDDDFIAIEDYWSTNSEEDKILVSELGTNSSNTKRHSIDDDFKAIDDYWSTNSEENTLNELNSSKSLEERNNKENLEFIISSAAFDSELSDAYLRKEPDKTFNESSENTPDHSESTDNSLSQDSSLKPKAKKRRRKLRVSVNIEENGCKTDHEETFEVEVLGSFKPRANSTNCSVESQGIEDCVPYESSSNNNYAVESQEIEVSGTYKLRLNNNTVESEEVKAFEPFESSLGNNYLVESQNPTNRQELTSLNTAEINYLAHYCDDYLDTLLSFLAQNIVTSPKENLSNLSITCGKPVILQTALETDKKLESRRNSKTRRKSSIQTLDTSDTEDKENLNHTLPPTLLSSSTEVPTAYDTSVLQSLSIETNADPQPTTTTYTPTPTKTPDSYSSSTLNPTEPSLTPSPNHKRSSKNRHRSNTKKHILTAIRLPGEQDSAPKSPTKRQIKPYQKKTRRPFKLIMDVSEELNCAGEQENLSPHKRDDIREKDILIWIYNMIDEPARVDYEFFLKDGCILCKLMNRINPGCIPEEEITWEGSRSKQKNISNFLTQAEKYGVPKAKLFYPEDLLHLRHIPRVTRCIYALAKIAQEDPALGFDCPRLGDEPNFVQPAKKVDIPGHRDTKEVLNQITASMQKEKEGEKKTLTKQHSLYK